ncbi:MAG: CHAP domain-containing protein [Candidatus Nomurabacteria bacterium]|jgi:surface antigen|nr:CHAP domain-containing protein [Candidatus Nomurabacteria bacterium]
MKKCRNINKKWRVRMVIFAVLALVVAAPFAVNDVILVSAKTKEELQQEQKELNNKIAEAERKITEYQDQVNSYASKAKDLNNEIAKLQAEQNELQAMIDLNQLKHDQLVEEIAAAEKKIQDNKDALGIIIADQYFATQISPIERLASSKNLSSYVDKEMAMSVVSDNLKATVDEIKTLKAELETKKAEQVRIIANQKEQKEVLDDKKREQQRILNETRGQETAFQNMKNEISAEKKQLEDEQQAILAELAKLNNASSAVPGDPNKGSYPWSSKCPDPYYNASLADNWGMYKCECVSYVAWRVDNKWGNMPYWGGRGNANKWLNNAKNAGIPTGKTPKVNSVGVSLKGTYGHVVWVEAVSGNRVYISQYNASNAATAWRKGDYSEQWIDASAYDGYIYFGEW